VNDFSRARGNLGRTLRQLPKFGIQRDNAEFLTAIKLERLIKSSRKHNGLRSRTREASAPAYVLYRALRGDLQAARGQARPGRIEAEPALCSEPTRRQFRDVKQPVSAEAN
jgi:hypothetical protein